MPRPIFSKSEYLYFLKKMKIVYISRIMEGTLPIYYRCKDLEGNCLIIPQHMLSIYQEMLNEQTNRPYLPAINQSEKLVLPIKGAKMMCRLRTEGGSSSDQKEATQSSDATIAVDDTQRIQEPCPGKCELCDRNPCHFLADHQANNGTMCRCSESESRDCRIPRPPPVPPPIRPENEGWHCSRSS